ncbi:hypothetical protein Q8A73_015545 [Channa argus]|nr:hypothetical protein Q8A73_015545 [Channa argus]
MCLVSYCEKHLQPHYDVAQLKKHKLVEPSKNLQENICSRHDEVMKMFCRTDQQCVCYLCSVDEHKGHDTVSAEAERTERQRELEGSRQQIQQRIQDRDKDVKVLQQEVEALNCSAEETVEDSEKIFTELIRLIEKRSSEVKQQIRSQQETEVSRVKELQEKLEQEITELKRKDAELEQLSHTEDHNQKLNPHKRSELERCSNARGGADPVWRAWSAMDSQRSSISDSLLAATGRGSVNTMPICVRGESYEAGEKKCISDVRRTFCLFVTFDLLFITLLWIIELNVKGSIPKQLIKEVLEYNYKASFFDIFLLAVFRFAVLILAYAVCRLRHWWAIAITTAVSSGFLIVKVIVSKLLSQGAFGYLLPIISFVLAWIETWLLDFKVLPQEAEDENRYRSLVVAAEGPPLMNPGPMSEGQFYSPPESLADSDEELDDKHDPEKGLLQKVT